MITSIIIFKRALGYSFLKFNLFENKLIHLQIKTNLYILQEMKK